MKNTLPTLLALVSQLALVSISVTTANGAAPKGAAPEFDLDSLLRQMETELPLEPKKTPPIKKPIKELATHNKHEQKIMSLFQNKIVPIADSLFKLIESKETLGLVDGAHKKRLEREKAFAAKVGKETSSRPRVSSVGSSSFGYSGRSDWGCSGYGSSGYGCRGYGDYGGHSG